VSELIVIAGIGYLIGTISFARIVGRLALPGEDLSVTEYEVAGLDIKSTYVGVSASSIMERAGWKWGLAVIALDAAKAFVPTLIVRILYPDDSLHLLMGAAVIIGHVWPVWWRFLGGRGQSALLGAALAIDVAAIPVAVLGSALVGVVGFTSVYMARNMFPAIAVPWFAVMADAAHVWWAIAINVVYWIASRNDVREELRIRNAKEISQLDYLPRLRRAWHDFLHED
jgi:glycerol-3-phosphate acyltransferase PlsY